MAKRKGLKMKDMDAMHLVCGRCGKREEDPGKVLMYKVRHPGIPEDRIPYVCEDCGGSTDDDTV